MPFDNPRDKKIKNFLQKISMIESSGGQNFNHPRIPKGMHEGHRAIGHYGLMPNTVDELIQKRKIAGNLNPEYQKLEALNPQEVKQFLEQNPEVEQDFARQLAEHVLNRQKGDELKAAYSWERGHNLSPETIESRPDWTETDYLKKYKKLLEQEKFENLSDYLKRNEDVRLKKQPNRFGNLENILRDNNGN